VNPGGHGNDFGTQLQWLAATVSNPVGGTSVTAGQRRLGDLARLSGDQGQRGAGTAGMLAPLAFGHDELRRLQGAAQRGETCRIETRDFSTADPLLPSSLYPYPIAAQHESRLLDRLPGYAIDTPSVTFIRHVSTSGSAGLTSEGGTKPEVVFETDARYRSQDRAAQRAELGDRE
jgi:hypothetical protein